MLHPSPTPISRLSHSDYCSLSSSDDDTEAYPKYCVIAGGTHPGICPHCKKTYKDPVTLQCGHSLCAKCCAALLESCDKSTIPRRSRIRMGLSSVSYSQLERKNISLSTATSRFEGIKYKSPQCIVCGERPKATPPVPNLELAMFLRSLKVEKMTEYENPAYRENIEDDSFSYDDDNCKRIRECRIGVVGASGVGKTSLTRVQYGNDILFSDLLGNRAEASLSNTFMLDIVDSNNNEDCIQTSQGFVIMYSITDRQSFYDAADIFTMIEQARGGNIPIVLVGSKSDLCRKRHVTAYEGQSLARHIGCPFLEISAKTNDCVNEAFLELMRLVEKKRLTLT
ncbi:Ras family protein [Dictyocaulus viviparus]|uniref:Ras family protein n=1 Tax=Dictyocaulus viviparus TaxID=29172 RepID=A0A0D8XMK0_DICVI|nr:Ras family protein [Dictyocaulus viviparus]